MGLGAERHAKAVSLSLSALLGLGLALTVYPLSFLLGDAARFHSHTLAPNDAIEYTLAWRALADHGAPWPSVRSDIFNHPEGASTTLMDGLPLAATLARPFKGLLPDGFHYFGVWTALAIVLQGVAGVALLRAAGVRSIAPALCAATFALTMPIFIGRLNQSHVALSTQGLLILAIALCVLATRERIALGRVFGAAAPLALASVAVHPLLGLQVLLFALLALMLAAARWPARLGAAGALCVAFVALCAWLGVFDVESLGNQVALGAFGYSPLAMLVGEPDAMREFYNSQGVEQETWLGWGCVLALAGAAIARPRGRLANTALAWVILVLALAAVSPWWRHGTNYYDWSFLLPDWVRDLYAVHRATARLAWPAVVVLTILPLAHVVRTWPRRRAMLLLGVALPLQLWAAYPYWRAEHAQARLSYMPPAHPPALMAGATRLLVSPEIRPWGLDRSHLRLAMHLALESGVPLASGVFARPPRTDQAERQRAWRTPAPGVRYLAVAPQTGPLPKRLPRVPVALECVRWETLAVCKARGDGANAFGGATLGIGAQTEDAPNTGEQPERLTRSDAKASP